VKDQPDLHRRIAEHNVVTCDQCAEYLGRRWRSTYTKSARESNYRRAILAHARAFKTDELAEAWSPTPTATRYTTIDSRAAALIEGMPDWLRERWPDAEAVVSRAFAGDHDPARCDVCVGHVAWVASMAKKGEGGERAIADRARWRHPVYVHAVEVASKLR
jgi:hypothetical protein